MKRSSGPTRRGRDRGAALVELALCLPLLAMLAFVTADVARGYQLRNRLAGAAREGAAVAQFVPSNFGNSGCAVGERTVMGAARDEDPSLKSTPSYTITEQRVKPDGTKGAVISSLTALCPTGANLPVPGDHVIITVSSKLSLLSPLAQVVLGRSTMTVSVSTEVVVQGEPVS